MSTILQSQEAALGCFWRRCLSWDCHPLPLLLCLLRSREREQLGQFPKVRANPDVQARVGDGHAATLDVQPVERDTTLGHLTRQQSNLYFTSSNSWDMCIHFWQKIYIVRTKFSIFTFLLLMIKQFSSCRRLFGWNWQNVYFSVSAINRATRAPSAAETAFSCRRWPPAFFSSFSLSPEPGFQQKTLTCL